MRHNGVTPWDEDIDLLMLKFDCNRLITSFKHYVFLSIPQKPTLSGLLNFGEVCDEHFSAPDRLGNDFDLFVDIFPLDGIPSNPFQKSSSLNWFGSLSIFGAISCFRREVKLSDCNTVPLGFRAIIGRFLHILIPFHVIRKDLNSIYTADEYCTAKKVSFISINSKTLSNVFFSEAVHGHFEGNIFLLPTGYDSCLEIRHNDYMRISRKDDRYSYEIVVSLK